MQDWPLIWRIAVVLATLALSTVAWVVFRLWDRWERARTAELRNLPSREDVR